MVTLLEAEKGRHLDLASRHGSQRDLGKEELVIGSLARCLILLRMGGAGCPKRLC